jgi:hypothetical protein
MFAGHDTNHLLQVEGIVKQLKLASKSASKRTKTSPKRKDKKRR